MSLGELARLGGIFTALRAEHAGGDLGDDCALLRVGQTTLALSIDLSVEGVHFRREWLSFREIGWRATAAALSDLAAEGAKPLGVLVSVGLPGSGKDEAGRVDPARAIMSGAGAAARSVGANVLGGDLARSERYVVDVCVVGSADRPVRRRGARPGDRLWVTGTLGGAALGLASLRAGKPVRAARQRFARPEPRIAAGRWLAQRGARAMIDISDGLTTDAAHLARASGVGVEIALESIPCWPGVRAADAVSSGEEYELLVAMPRHFTPARRAADVAVTCVGRCTRERGVRFTEHGRPVAVEPGFDHFASR